MIAIINAQIFDKTKLKVQNQLTAIPTAKENTKKSKNLILYFKILKL